MTEKKYHHGDLKLALIEKGIKILDNDGYEGLSLRKVAKECNVSQTAPYRHFKNKEELLQAIIYHIMQEFNHSLELAVQKHPDDPKSQIKEMGVAYIRFFVDNPEYLRLVFLSDKRKMKSDMNAFQGQGYHSAEGDPFATFINTIERYASQVKTPDFDKDQLMLYCWGLAHGIAILIANREIPYPKDYMKIAEKLMWNELVLG